jgi:hypothetical protein
MATINLRRFANVETLRSLKENLLQALLSPHALYFEKRSVKLESPLDVDRLAAVFLAPDEGTPEALVNALYLIHEMSSPTALEELVDVVRRDPALRETIDLTSELTPLDLAIQVFLKAPALLEREHAERYVEQRKAFECYLPERQGVELAAVAANALSELEKELGAWFNAKLKGEHVRVFSYMRPDGVWFVVQHGEAFRREAARKDGESTTVFYRPERHDVLVYQPTTGELRVNATTKGERELYRRKFGRYLFGSEDHFRTTRGRFTLKPILERKAAALVCADVEGIDWIQLVEIAYVRPAEDPSDEPIVEVRVCRNVAKTLEGRDALPEKARIVRARFRVKFSRAQRPRHVSVRLPNVAMFTRDDDGRLVDEWLTKRGFALTGKEGRREDDHAAVACA